VPIGCGGGSVAGGGLVISLASENEAFSPTMPSMEHLPALYATKVTHSRRSPMVNHFRYRASYWLVDFDHLPAKRGIHCRIARFDREDHCDARDLLAEHGLVADRILLLTMARTYGYVFNPISVFWCYDEAGVQVALLVEVHNTYGGRHTYLLQPDESGRSEVDKALYVSPFYPVDGHYDIRVSEPGDSLSVTVTLRRKNDLPFVASLIGERRPVTTANGVRASVMYPALRTSILIRWQAVRLWIRGLKVQSR
jgi:uncharacterized protein